LVEWPLEIRNLKYAEITGVITILFIDIIRFAEVYGLTASKRAYPKVGGSKVISYCLNLDCAD